MMSSRIGLFGRIMLAMFFIGNMNFHIANEAVNLLVGDHQKMHHDILKNCSRTLLCLCTVILVFCEQLKSEWSVSFDGLLPVYVAVLLAVGLVAVQVALASAYGSTFHWQDLATVKIIYVGVVALCAAITEELLCRFIVLIQGRWVIGTAGAFVIQTLVFVFIHLGASRIDRDTIILIAAGGILLGAFYLLTGSLLAVIAFHFTYDALVMPAFGANLYGLYIFPLVVCSNASRVASTWAGIAYQLMAAIVIMVILIRRKDT